MGVVNETVAGWRYIAIEFMASSVPGRFVKMWAADFGVTRLIEDTEISGLRITEEVDPTVESLSVNMMYGKIRSRESMFSPITSPDFDDMMMHYQPLTVTRNGVLFGTFFLTEWTDPYQNGIEFDIEAMDATGVLDLYPFMGDIYIDKPIREVLDELFDIAFPTGLITYQLDPVFEGETISGWIPAGTCGLAFQHIMFSLNATADTARTGHVWIYPREMDIKRDSTPTTNDKQPFVDIENLKSYARPFYYITNEHNYPLLDEIVHELPDDTSTINTGWCSESMSYYSGAFGAPPTVNITFATNHILEALTFDFGPYEQEYIKTARITFYDEFDAVVSQKIYTFTNNKAIMKDAEFRYRRIMIEALETSYPYRFAKIYAIDYGRSFYIPLNQQYLRGRDEPTEYVSGVTVVSHSYAPGEESVEAYKGALSPGEHTIPFREPLHSLALTGGSIISSGANHAVINVTSGGEVALTGKKYIDNRLGHTVAVEAEAGYIENVTPYENYTLVKPGKGLELAQKLFGYLREPIETTVDIYLGNREVGYVAHIETRGRDVVGVITMMDINLRAGTATIIARGDVV